MASLYTHKEQNVRKTFVLFSAFLIVVIGLGWVFSYVFQSQGILVIAVLFSVITSLISYWFSDKIALSLSGAKQIEKKDNPYLYNMVENLTITAGLPMPRLYISPEQQINAFATGRDPKHAAVAVTAGALQRLENEELEGVLAHELSHVGNRDILVSTVAVVLAGVITLLSDFFLRSMFFGGMRGRDSDDNRAGGIMLLVGIALSLLAPLGATLMQLAISRRRESLADASGALLTRYPEGLANALQKIAQDQVPMHHAKNATAHLWISDPFKGEKVSWIHKLFMTHPPVQERINALRQMNVG